MFQVQSLNFEPRLQNSTWKFEVGTLRSLAWKKTKSKKKKKENEKNKKKLHKIVGVVGAGGGGHRTLKSDFEFRCLTQKIEH